MLLTFILATVFATAVLSGVLGMAGGMILMAILVSTLSVAGAMIVHGVVQAVSNGSRAWFLRHHIQWRILPAYTLGAAAALAGFAALSLMPNAGVVLILVGAFPFAARWNARLSGLDVTQPATTLACGFTVTAAQLLAGASGPLLDAFYLNTPLSRQQVVASKAITQTLGHLVKLFYYGLIIGVAEELPGWFFVLAAMLAVAGARSGVALLHRWNDERFRTVSGRVILVIAAVCVARGAYELVAA